MTQQKLIGSYIFQEQLFEVGPRTYHKCIKRNDASNARFYFSQTIKKSPIIAHLKQAIHQLKSIKSNNVLCHHEYQETANNYYIFTEYCNEGTLESIIHDNIIEEDIARDYLRQILNGLKTLHENGVGSKIDLSLSSIFVHNGVIKVGQVNLGQSIIQDSDQKLNFEIFKDLLSEQALEGNKSTSFTDLYYVGIIYFRILFGQYPITGTTRQQLQDSMKSFQMKSSKNLAIISPESLDFLQKILIYNSQDRMKWSDVYNHKLLKILHIASKQLTNSEQNSSNLLIEQSILLSKIQICNIISLCDLNSTPFDVQQHANFYKQKQQQQCLLIAQNNEPDNSYKDFKMNDGTEVGINYLQLQMTLDEIALIEQRQQQFKFQMQRFLVQRNLYARFSNVLTLIRVFSDDSILTKQVEFLVIKSMHLIGDMLYKKIESVEPSLIQIQVNQQDNLFMEYQNLKLLVRREGEVISSQLNQSLKINEKQLKNCSEVSNQFKQILNFELDMRIFAELFKKCQTYVENLLKSKVAQLDPILAQLHMVKLNCYLIITILFLRGKINEIYQTFPEELYKYDKSLDDMKLEELQKQHLQNKVKLEYLLL